MHMLMRKRFWLEPAEPRENSLDQYDRVQAELTRRIPEHMGLGEYHTWADYYNDDAGYRDMLYDLPDLDERGVRPKQGKDAFDDTVWHIISQGRSGGQKNEFHSIEPAHLKSFMVHLLPNGIVVFNDLCNGRDTGQDPTFAKGWQGDHTGSWHCDKDWIIIEKPGAIGTHTLWYSARLVAKGETTRRLVDGKVQYNPNAPYIYDSRKEARGPKKEKPAYQLEKFDGNDYMELAYFGQWGAVESDHTDLINNRTLVQHYRKERKRWALDDIDMVFPNGARTRLQGFPPKKRLNGYPCEILGRFTQLPIERIDYLGGSPTLPDDEKIQVMTYHDFEVFEVYPRNLELPYEKQYNQGQDDSYQMWTNADGLGPLPFDRTHGIDGSWFWKRHPGNESKWNLEKCMYDSPITEYAYEDYQTGMEASQTAWFPGNDDWTM